MEAQEQSTKLPATINDDALAPIDNGRSGLLMHTFDETDPDQVQRLMCIVQDDRLTTKECRDQEIEIEHLVCMAAALPDDDSGEITYRQRVFLVPPDGGEVVSSTAKGVIDSLRLALRFYGKPPWRPARKFKVKTFSTSKGRDTIKLLPVK